MAAPVSAFARRKAAHHAGITDRVKAKAPIALDQQSSDESIKVALHKKKRKRGFSPAPTNLIPSPPIEALALHNDLSEVMNEEFEGSDGDSVEGSLEDSIWGLDDSKSVDAVAQQLSIFTATKSNVLEDTDSAWTIRLHPNDNLVVLGQYDLWARSGAVSILGAVIHASSKLHRVYAPSTHSLPSIKPVQNPFGTGNPACEISLISCKSRIRLLDNIAPKFGRIWNARKSSLEPGRSFINMQNSADDSYLRPLRRVEPPTDWQSTISRSISSDCANFSVIICGPKGSGKSTFCRMLINALLATLLRRHQNDTNAMEDDSVAFLDLDPGQPEYSPPGEISLRNMRSYNLGPPFTHPTSIHSNDMVKAHHFGHLSPKEDPVQYYRCALDLFSSYKALSVGKRSCPLIVNCSGWIQGTGLDLMVDLISDLELSDVIYMSTEGPEEVVDALAEAAHKSNTPLHQLTSQASNITTRTAADLRMMQTLSYFHLDEPERESLRWKAKPLTSFPPMVVYYAGSKQGIAAVMLLGDEQNPEFIGSILEGCLVGIVAVDEDVIADEGMGSATESINDHDVDMDVEDRVSTTHVHESRVQDVESEDFSISVPTDGQPTIRRTSTGIPYLTPHNHATPPLPPSRSHSLGQALIRGIDTLNKTFHLLTPIHPSTIKHYTQEKHQKIVLVRGKLDTPTWAYAEQFEYEKARRRQREKVLGEKEEFGADDVREWAEGQLWASVVDGGRSGSGKVRRVRRDIRYKGQGQGQKGEAAR